MRLIASPPPRMRSCGGHAAPLATRCQRRGANAGIHVTLRGGFVVADGVSACG